MRRRRLFRRIGRHAVIVEEDVFPSDWRDRALEVADLLAGTHPPIGTTDDPDPDPVPIARATYR